jgi:hypothetical protein
MRYQVAGPVRSPSRTTTATRLVLDVPAHAVADKAAAMVVTGGVRDYYLVLDHAVRPGSPPCRRGSPRESSTPVRPSCPTTNR